MKPTMSLGSVFLKIRDLMKALLGMMNLSRLSSHYLKSYLSGQFQLAYLFPAIAFVCSVSDTLL